MSSTCPADVKAKLDETEEKLNDNEDDETEAASDETALSRKRKLPTLLRDDNRAQKLAHVDVLKLKDEGEK